MILIIGGAWQGKLNFAKNEFSLSENDIFTCENTEIDFSKRCVYRLEEFALACVQAGIEPIDRFREHEEKWKDSILICQDIFCGVVPIDGTMRAWRDAAGRLCQYLSANAERVSRIFCGLEQRLK